MWQGFKLASDFGFALVLLYYTVLSSKNQSGLFSVCLIFLTPKFTRYCSPKSESVYTENTKRQLTTFSFLALT